MHEQTRLVQKADVIIVGGGPAGSSTALHLLRSGAFRRRRVLIVDKARHPRHKLCGGGLTPFADATFQRLDLQLAVPSVAVHQIRFRFGGTTCVLHGDPAMRVVRRDQLDAWLLQQAKAAGAEVLQGVAVDGVRVDRRGVEVSTSRGRLRAPAVVAADGSGSTVLRSLGLRPQRTAARLLEVWTPPQPDEDQCWEPGIATFDFTSLLDGVHGYLWDFPSLEDGRPMMNSGVFDSGRGRRRPVPLQPVLRSWLLRRGVRPGELPRIRGFPLLQFRARGPFAQPRILFAGDAAGADPLYGEGIPFALAYGEVAARTLIAAFDGGDFSFADYRPRVLQHDLLRRLRRRSVGASVVYRLGQGTLRRVDSLLQALVGVLPPRLASLELHAEPAVMASRTGSAAKPVVDLGEPPLERAEGLGGGQRFGDVA